MAFFLFFSLLSGISFLLLLIYSLGVESIALTLETVYTAQLALISFNRIFGNLSPANQHVFSVALIGSTSI